MLYYIAGMQRAKYWKQLHGKNLTIKFECDVILSKVCGK